LAFGGAKAAVGSDRFQLGLLGNFERLALAFLRCLLQLLLSLPLGFPDRGGGLSFRLIVLPEFGTG